MTLIRVGSIGAVKLRLLIVALITVGIGVVLARRQSRKAQAEADLWAEATDSIR